MKRRPIRWWLDQTRRTENGAAIAVSRILVALCVLALVAPLCVTEAGRQTVTFGFCDVAHGGYKSITGSWFLRLLGGPQPRVLFALLATAGVSAFCLLAGVFGRVPALICAICTSTALTQNTEVSGGGDALLGVALLILVLADCTSTLSVDCFLRTRRWIDETPIAGWPRLLGLFHLTTVYVATGLQKLVSTAWWPLDDFSALYQILQSPHWSRFPLFVEQHANLLVVPLAIGTAVTILFEVSFWVALLSHRLRIVYALVGIGLHLGIALFMEVGIFSWLSLALYPLLFPNEFARWARRLAPKPGIAAEPGFLRR